MLESKSSKRSASGTRMRWLATLSLTLILISSTGCPKLNLQVPPDTTAEQLAVCKQWNTEQWASYNVLIQLAKREGDPYGLKPVALATGAILKRCFPQSFEPRNDSK